MSANHCVNGGTYARGSFCRTDRSRNFSGAVPPALIAWEREVIQRHFGATMEEWERSDRYHLYMIQNDLVSTDTREATVWYEYRMAPAPTLTNRSMPVMEGDRSQAHTVTSLGRGPLGPRLPLPGGPVRHYVNWGLKAIINATERGHVLNPGTIMRFLSEEGGMYRSNTVGRGIGARPRINEVMGLEIFDDLDDLVRGRINGG